MAWNWRAELPEDNLWKHVHDAVQEVRREKEIDTVFLSKLIRE